MQARTRRTPRSLALELVTVLTERIRSGQFKRGDKLPTESQIMAEEGASRTVVREAISRLQAAGQVETRHRQRIENPACAGLLSLRAVRLPRPATVHSATAG